MHISACWTTKIATVADALIDHEEAHRMISRDYVRNAKRHEKCCRRSTLLTDLKYCLIDETTGRPVPLSD